MAKRTQSVLRGIVTDNTQNGKLADNSAGDISAQDVREVLTDIVDSPLFEVTAADIPANAISQGKIASNAVTSGKLATGAVTAAKIGDNQVTEDKLDSDTANKLVGSHSRTQWDSLDIRTITGFSVSGQILTITWTDSDGDSQHLDATLPLGGGGNNPPAQTHSLFLGLSADSTFTASELTVSVASGTDINLPATWAGNQHIGLAVPSDREITAITYTGGLGNAITDFTKQAGTLPKDGETVEVWVSDNAFPRSGFQSGTVTFTVTTRSG